MSAVALGSVRSCGASTLALGLVATWPEGRPVLLVEADPAGGTLAATAGWPGEPSLVSLAAAARHGGDPGIIDGHCHFLPGGAKALVAPASAEQARTALGMLGTLFGHLGDLEADVVVDCGRLDPGSPAMALVEQANRLVLVARPRLSDLHAVAAWLASHGEVSGHVSLVAVGDGPYPDAEIADALGTEVAARLPWGPDAAMALAHLPASARQLRAAPLVRAARTLAEHLADELAPVPAVVPAAPGPPRASRRHRLVPWRPEAVGAANGTSPEGATP